MGICYLLSNPEEPFTFNRMDQSLELLLLLRDCLVMSIRALDFGADVLATRCFPSVIQAPFGAAPAWFSHSSQVVLLFGEGFNDGTLPFFLLLFRAIATLPFDGSPACAERQLRASGYPSILQTASHFCWKLQKTSPVCHAAFHRSADTCGLWGSIGHTFQHKQFLGLVLLGCRWLNTDHGSVHNLCSSGITSCGVGASGVRGCCFCPFL